LKLPLRFVISTKIFKIKAIFDYELRISNPQSVILNS
jgi:hypothetical protein